MPLSLFFAPASDDGDSSSRHRDIEARTADDARQFALLRSRDVPAAQRALAVVFETYYARLCDVAFRYVHSRDEAQDIVQDVFTRLWRERAALQITVAPAGYLYTATRNLSLNRLRHAHVEQTWKDHGDAWHQAHPPAADEVLEMAERHAAIVQAIAELPERRRAVCMLRWGQGMSYAAIAQRLGISERTVDTQLHRAIVEIRGKVAGR